MSEQDIIDLMKELISHILDLKEVLNVSDSEFVDAYNEVTNSLRNNYTVDYDNNAKCLSYAMRYGIKTCYQTWLNLEVCPDISFDPSSIIILGGGCSFELPVFMNYFDLSDSRIRIYDRFADHWEIFSDLHEHYGLLNGGNLNIRYLQVNFPNATFQRNMNRVNPTLLICSNLLNEVRHDDIEEFYSYSSGRGLFLQDMSWQKFSMIRRQYDCFLKCKNHINSFPEDELNRYTVELAPFLDGVGCFSGHNGRKNYILVKEE